MKNIKTYNLYNESLRDKMKGKSEEDMIKVLDDLSDEDKIKNIIIYKLPYDLLPDELIIDFLDCNNCEITSLPDNLTVEDDFYCYSNLLKKLPNNLIINGDLFCDNNELTSLPDDLKVGGSIHCYGNQLPYNIKKPVGVKREIYY